MGPDRHSGPALHAIVPNIVPREVLDRAIAMSSTNWNAASIVGPVVAGYLILLLDRQIYGVIAPFRRDADRYHSSHRFGSPGEGRSVEDICGGIQYVRGKPITFLIG